MISKSLLKKSGIYFIGNLSSKMMSAILIPIYAFYVSSEELGYFDFSQTIMGILSPIILFAIWEAVLKFVLSEDDKKNKRKIITTTSIFSLIMSVLFVVGTILFSLLYEQPIRFLELIVGMIILHSLVFVWQYYTRANGQNKLFVVSGIISTLVNFIFVLLFVVVLKMGLLGLLIAYNLGQLSILVIIEFKLGVIKNIRKKDFDYHLLRKMLKFSTPLVLNLTSTWLITGFGRFMITIKLGTEANGLYSFANRFSLIISMIGTVVTMAIIEEAILSVKEKRIDKDFNKTIESLFKIFQQLIVLAVPAIMIFYSFLTKTEYHNAVTITPWLLLYAVMITMSSNLGSVFQATSKTKYQFLTTLFGAIVTVIISVCFIEVLGVTAIIVAQILGALVMLISRYLLINKFIEFTVNWKPIIIRVLLFIGVTITCLNMNLYINILILLVIFSFLFYTNKNMIIIALSKLRAK